MKITTAIGLHVNQHNVTAQVVTLADDGLEVDRSNQMTWLTSAVAKSKDELERWIRAHNPDYVGICSVKKNGNMGAKQVTLDAIANVRKACIGIARSKRIHATTGNAALRRLGEEWENPDQPFATP